ncbi:hypothetical protein Bpfe_004162 [Biomphalaria pfeifferi]|uniref:REM-1 domain-containing protein n=1 Tax=Biomphalaria pfeifferi TaxID=112525 RepID=A0AAD8C5M2_BIOPF|nr:hypothetical protein Bpfe_004162 [Biomphalaria pfeifferi]
MHTSVCLWLTSLVFLFVSCRGELELAGENEVKNVRAWNPPELIRVGMYWKSFAKRRLDALDRCERRLAIYVERLKMAQDILGGLAKRNVNLDVAQIKTLKQETSVAELSLLECVNQITKQNPLDPFYKDCKCVLHL